MNKPLTGRALVPYKVKVSRSSVAVPTRPYVRGRAVSDADRPRRHRQVDMARIRVLCASLPPSAKLAFADEQPSACGAYLADAALLFAGITSHQGGMKGG